MADTTETTEHRDALVERIRALCEPLEPRATETEAVLSSFEGIRAVVFDVYGTLLISASGDIGVNTAEDRGAALGEAVDAVGGELNGLDTDDRGVELLHRHIHRFHERLRAEGVAYPEVDIRTVWRDVLTELAGEDLVADMPESVVEALAIEYECRVNPVWPMPGLIAALASVREAGLMLGIVSNAQFFTPLLFDALLDASVESLGFDEALCVWSYAMLEAKPSTALYERLIATLGERGVEPSQVLYVGNDVRNDIRPAAAVGLRTVLFAGDRRSLRLRADDPTCADVKPDAVVTSLDQVAGLYGA
ncbi:MAG: HAD family hydrolase [Phycisphaera sp.]|nr:HAD family hydrolase [Phycisphaera sp.]